MTALPQEFQLVSNAQSTRIILPPRRRTQARFVGCIPMVFGLVFCLIPLFVVANIFDVGKHAVPAGPEGPAQNPGFDLPKLLHLLFLVPFIAGGLLPIFLGLLMILPSHAEIEVTDEELVSIDYSGPFRFTKRRPLASISTIRCSNQSSGVQVAGLPTECIAVENSTGMPLQLARRYLREQLVPLANFLVEQLNQRNFGATLHAGDAEAKVTLAIDPPAVPFVADLPPVSPIDPPPQQPAGSKITLIATPESLTFAIPRTGFHGLALVLLIACLICNGVILPMITFVIVEFMRQLDIEHFLPICFLMIFVMIGIGLALAALQTAFRRAVFVATRDSLIYTQRGPIRNVEYQWKPDELTSIRADFSGTVLDDRRLRELRIVSKADIKHGFMDGRDDAELEWFAATLREFYGMRQ